MKTSKLGGNLVGSDIQCFILPIPISKHQALQTLGDFDGDDDDRKSDLMRLLQINIIFSKTNAGKKVRSTELDRVKYTSLYQLNLIFFLSLRNFSQNFKQNSLFVKSDFNINLSTGN